MRLPLPALWAFQAVNRATLKTTPRRFNATAAIVTVFNLQGDHSSLLATLHYNRQLCFALRFPTHAEYSKDRWKDKL